MIEKIHEEAMRAAQDFKTAEIVLLEKVEQVAKHKVYLHYNCKNLYHYCTQVLKLTENVSYNLIAVCEKIKEVPALKESIKQGELTVATARKIVPVLTQFNQSEWISKASELSQKQLARELAKRFPHQMKKEKLQPVGDGIYSLELDISEEVRELLERARDLESQRTKKACKIEETLKAALQYYIEKNDPMKKAERTIKRQKKISQSQGVISSRLSSKDVSELKKTSISVQDSVKNPESRKGLAVESVTEARVQTATETETDATETETEFSCIPVSPISSASVSHIIMLRDQGQCTARMLDGQRCPDKRWIHEHHIIPRFEGGPDTPENLTLLCEGHHRLHHFTENLKH
jgi:hypothetical protein